MANMGSLPPWIFPTFTPSATETVKTPTRPYGNTRVTTGVVYKYGGGDVVDPRYGINRTSANHPISGTTGWQFDFDAGGAGDLSSWGSRLVSKTWSTSGSYLVRCRARYSESIVSSWSEPLFVEVLATLNPPGDVSVFRNNFFDFPLRGFPYTLVFPILDADGDPIESAAGLSAMVSRNGNEAQASDNSVYEIATAFGMYYLLLSATETDADVVAVKVSSTTEGAKTTCLTPSPRKVFLVEKGDCAADSTATLIKTTVPNNLFAGKTDDFYRGMLFVLQTDPVQYAIINHSVYLGDDTEQTEIYLYSALDSVPDEGTDYKIYEVFFAGIGTVNVSPRSVSAIATATASASAYAEGAELPPIEGPLTFAQMLRIMFAALAGLSTGGGSNNFKFRDYDNSKDRINEIVDLYGNRLSVTLDGD